MEVREIPPLFWFVYLQQMANVARIVGAHPSAIFSTIEALGLFKRDVRHDGRTNVLCRREHELGLRPGVGVAVRFNDTEIP